MGATLRGISIGDSGAAGAASDTRSTAGAATEAHSAAGAATETHGVAAVETVGELGTPGLVTTADLIWGQGLIAPWDEKPPCDE